MYLLRKMYFFNSFFLQTIGFAMIGCLSVVAIFQTTTERSPEWQATFLANNFLNKNYFTFQLLDMIIISFQTILEVLQIIPKQYLEFRVKLASHAGVFYELP